MSDTLTRLNQALTGRYLVEKEIGAGGMATVYLARDIKHDREVAVKVLREDLSASLGAGRFLREIKIAAQLQHPHILPLLDSGESDGFLYFVMPYIKGQSMRERLAREGELPVHEAVRLLTEVVDALVEAHAHGVVHRDIKPDNVMLSGRHALVTDFGVAKAISEATGGNTVTTLGVAVGTPTYMSPEQAAADPHVDHRSDIYSVGVMAYEMLSGKPPFTGHSPQQVLAAHVTEAPDPVSKRRTAIPPALEQIVMKCLAKRPADRFQTAAELHTALEPLATPSGGLTPTGTQPISAVTRSRRVSDINRAAALAVVAAGVIVVAAVIFSVMRNRGEAHLAIANTRILTTEAGLYLDPSPSPDGKFIAFTAGPPTAMRIGVRQVDNDHVIPLAPDVPGTQRWPQWSPDGTRITFAGSDGIYVVPALGGTAQHVVTLHFRGAVASPTWSPDGKRIAFSAEGQVRVLDLATGGISKLFDQAPKAGGVTRVVFDLRWSPDGRWIAAAAGNWEFAFGGLNLGNVAPARLLLIPTDTTLSAVAIPSRGSLDLSPVWFGDSRRLLFISDRDGSRDVYETELSGDRKSTTPPVRLSTGLNAHSIALSADGSTMMYSSYTPSADIWSLSLSPNAAVSVRNATPLTHGTDVIEEVVVSPDNTRVLFTANRSGLLTLYVIPITGGTAKRITPDSIAQRPTWSPDSREIAYWVPPLDQLRIVPAEGGVPVIVTASGFNRAEWGPDGNSLVLMAGDSLHTLSLTRRTADGWETPHTIPGITWADYPSWSPDGKLIAFRQLLGAVHDTGVIAVMHPEGGAARVLIRENPGSGIPRPETLFWAKDGHSLYYRSIDPQGEVAIWSLPLSGGIPRLLVRFDDPERAGTLRTRFSIANGVYYGRIMHQVSVIGIAQLVTK